MDQLGVAHYVPILRWKKAEQTALAKLSSSDARCVTPLIEIVPGNLMAGGDRRGDIGQTANRMSSELFRVWNERPFYVDLHNLPEDLLTEGPRHLLTLLGECGSTRGLSMIPVTELGKRDVYQSAVVSVLGSHKQGVCVRLSRDDLRRPTLGCDTLRVLASLTIEPEHADLLIDLGAEDGNDADVPSLMTICKVVPNVAQWRNFILAGGAFPVDLSQLQKNRIHRTVRRVDWIFWRDQTLGASQGERLPTYSDYTVQHARYQERKEQSNYSASIRYTSSEYWVIMRGEGVLNEDGPGAAQWPANAQLLCEQPEYCLGSFSYGDKYIKEMSLQTERTGTATTWLQAGINHHMTFVVRELASLFGASVVAAP